MDSNKAYQSIKDALLGGEILEAIDRSIDLSIWANNGGFLPDGLSKARFWAIMNFIAEIDPTDQLRKRDFAQGETGPSGYTEQQAREEFAHFITKRSDGDCWKD